MNVPAELRLVEEFLNTLDERSFRRKGVEHTGGDALPTPDALGQWLGDHGLITTGSAGEADLVLAHDLRAALRAAVRGSAELAKANAVFAVIPLRAELGADGKLRLAGPKATVPAALTELLAIAVRSSADGSWARLRSCAAPDCRWVFYDDSRNGAGRWCSMSSCGNRLKTARYRERKALNG